MLAAYTGVEARNIGGQTSHSLLQMTESGREVGAKVSFASHTIYVVVSIHPARRIGTVGTVLFVSRPGVRELSLALPFDPDLKWLAEVAIRHAGPCVLGHVESP